MPYTKFEDGVPLITDTGGEQITDIRNNLEALRDAVAIGALVDWEMTVTAGAGTNEEPDSISWSDGTTTIVGTMTWSAGNLTQVVYTVGADTIGTWSGTYVSGTLTATTWT